MHIGEVNRGYFLILQYKEKIKKLLLNHNWQKTAFLSTNSALNLRKSLIENIVIKNGFIDRKGNIKEVLSKALTPKNIYT